MGMSDCWCSPPEIATPLVDLFGGPVGMDPCSNERSIIQAFVALTHGGLVLPWCTDGVPRTAYENFPYSQGQVWTDKALHELATGNVAELVRLSMMATSSQWWADACLKAERNPRILGLKRLKFISPAPESRRAGGARRMTCRFEPALMYFGPRPEVFTKTFAHLTRWSTWGR